MKAKVLIGHWPQEHGHTAYRIYMEPDYEQSEKDLNLLSEADTGGKSYHLQECEVFLIKKK